MTKIHMRIYWSKPTLNERKRRRRKKSIVTNIRKTVQWGKGARFFGNKTLKFRWRHINKSRWGHINRQNLK